MVDDAGPKPSGKTRLRPQRSAAASDPPRDRPAASPTPPRFDGNASRISVDAFIADGRNRLLAAAGPLLSLGSRLDRLAAHGDVEGLRQQAQQAVSDFERRAASAGVSTDDIQVASFVLCTFVDTAVYRTPWGAESNWATNPLLIIFHDTNDGGETFFEILERIQTEPQRYRDLLELMFVCLQLGYVGRYRNDRAKLVAIQDRLLLNIRSLERGGASASIELSPNWRGVVDNRRRVMRFVPLWIVALAGLVLLTSTWLVLRYQLSQSAVPVLERFAAQRIEFDFSEQPAPPVAAERLRQFLLDAERAGLITVEESGPRTLVTLLGRNVFSSGSATLAPEFEPVIEEIARAAERVPGRVVVIGHTDDVPIRSFRFRDNHDLSRARAMAVASLMRNNLSDPNRVEWAGVGAADPRYRPAYAPENRARNRRVEIVHESAAGGR